MSHIDNKYINRIVDYKHVCPRDIFCLNNNTERAVKYYQILLEYASRQYYNNIISIVKTL